MMRWQSIIHLLVLQCHLEGTLVTRPKPSETTEMEESAAVSLSKLIRV